MAKIHDHDPVVDVIDTTERVVNIRMNGKQVKTALFIWLRLQGIKLPSQNQDDYNHIFLREDGQYRMAVTLEYKERK